MTTFHISAATDVRKLIIYLLAGMGMIGEGNLDREDFLNSQTSFFSFCTMCCACFMLCASTFD